MPIFDFNAQSVKEKMYQHNQIDNFGYRVCRKCYRKFAADEKGYAEGLVSIRCLLILNSTFTFYL